MERIQLAVINSILCGGGLVVGVLLHAAGEERVFI